MEREILVASVLLVCVFTRAQSQTASVYPSESSMLSAESFSLSAVPAPAWVARYNGPGNADDVAKAIALDSAGNVYVTGYNTGSNGFRNYATAKYNNAGVKQWVVGYNGSGNQNDEAFAIAIDGYENTYVTGYSYGSNGSTDYATIKYNNVGIQQWVARYNGPASLGDTAVAVIVDGFGNVYVTGQSTGISGYSGGYLDYVTIKYNGAGVRQWVARYNGSGNYNDIVTSLAVDNSGNVYITGYGYGTGSRYSYATIKYSNMGTMQWVARYRGKGLGDNQAYAVAVDGSGNAYVTGRSCEKNNNYNYATLKYNSAGVRQWISSYNGTGNSTDEAKALTVDDAGNVYVMGYSTSSNGYQDYATVKYNNEGIQQWVARYNGPGNKDDLAYALKIDSSGNVYVTGYSTRSNGYLDYATVKYNNAGVQQWVARYNGPANSHDGANAIALDGSGNVYVTGYSTSSNGTKDYVTIKYLASSSNAAFSETADSKSDNPPKISTDATLPTNFSLAQNFPNPFNPTTTIHFDMPIAGYAKLVIYNLRGELVRTLVDGAMAAGYHRATLDATGLASGIYFYRLQIGNAFTAMRKMVVQK
jgi:uncharacterized delta-60 repeat protein